MKDKVYAIFDIEANGLYKDVTKIHCLSYAVVKDNAIIDKKTTADYNEIKDFFKRDMVFIGHNIIRYDIPTIEKTFSIKLDDLKVIDTLGLSWYLFSNQKKHGLEWWGDFLEIKKPEVEDWENLSQEVYFHRCETDVEINTKLYFYFLKYLKDIYEDENRIERLFGYLNFKLDCLKEQELSGIPLDVDKCIMHLNNLTPDFDKKYKELSSIMPKNLGKILHTRPKKLYKKDGNLSIHGEKWVKTTSDLGLNFNDVEEIREEPNPGSDLQLKKWLFSLGWKPVTFKLNKKTGENIPQVSLPFGGGICQSVKDLYEVEPKLAELEGYFMIKHRIGIFKSFLESEEDGVVYATAQGFTNTCRLTHKKPVVNLPKPGVFYGKECREVLKIPNDDFIMCGSDISSLEDTTKQHYIYFFDPKYVQEMRVPGFDPHLDIGILAGLIEKEDSEFFKYFEKLSEEEKKNQSHETHARYKRIKKARGTSKTSNFAATYGAGAKKIAVTAKISLEEADKLHKTYWERNSAVKKTANACTVKTVTYPSKITRNVQSRNSNGEIISDNVIEWVNKTQKWLYNPMSGFYMFLKADKDKFSTLNQSKFCSV